jgi:hypothetical protein
MKNGIITLLKCFYRPRNIHKYHLLFPPQIKENILSIYSYVIGKNRSPEGE